MTARRAQPAEPETSLRAELVEQIAGAQGELESNIEVLRRAAVAGGDAGALGQAEAQAHALARLQHRIGRADPSTLAAIRAEVVASVAASVALTQTARTTAANAQTAEVALHAAQAEARKVVNDFTHDFYERKIFDPYLKFASAEDERAYREREEKNRREIKKARAEGTPEGDLRALNLTREQLRDAGAHGASASPDYARLEQQTAAAEQNLAAQIAARQGHATQPEPAIDPLDAIAPSKNIPPSIIANLRAAGVSIPPPETQGHGVTTTAAAETNRGRA